VKIACIYGNPKTGGFVHGCLDRVAGRLADKGAEVTPIRLAESDIRHCTGCFACLAEGKCPINDDMERIIAAMRDADGWVAGASVRNGYFPALYKTFYERITYLFAFTWVMFEKHVLGISAVGYAGGKTHTRKVVGMTANHSNLSSFLFFRTGIPSALEPRDVGKKLAAAADRLFDRIRTNPRPPAMTRLGRRIDQAVIYHLMVKRKPETYRYVLDEWRRKGYLGAGSQV